MLKRILVLFKDNILLFAVGVTLAILYLSLMRVPKVDVQIVHIDKWYHSLAYFVLTLSWLLTFYKKPEKKYVIIMLCIILGIIIEGLQHALTMYRTADYLDIIANTIGVLLALVTFNLIFRKKTIN